MSKSPNAGQTALTLQHTSGYNVPPGHNIDGYTMAERVSMAKGGRAENPIRKTTGKGGNYRKTKSGAGMTKKGVAAYRRANPGSKLKTAVTGKVKKGSKAANRRKSYCARSAGQLRNSSAKTRNDPNSRIRQARRRWKC
jgi:hypothetical protein